MEPIERWMLLAAAVGLLGFVATLVWMLAAR
jgi:hypothetical protein